MGNARVGGNWAIDRELVATAGQAIVTTERIVDKLSGLADLPGIRTTAVVEVPRGAWPTSCYPLYPVDGEEILAYLDQAGSGCFHSYLEHFMRGNSGLSSP